MQRQDKLYKHTKLLSGYIRVLDLQPTSPDAEPGLVCRLIAQKIADAPYEALSYVWGKPTVFHSTIWCQDDADEGMLHIGANLATALLAYRRPDRPRRIWVDAICIQQDDLDERLRQVRMMGDVFRSATQVLCWLGAFQKPTTDESLALTAIAFLRDFNKDQNGHLRQIQSHLHRSNKGSKAVGDEGRGTDGEEKTLENSWRSIKAFFDCEYFHRAWIIQEIGLASCAWISWGRSDICIEWTEVARFVLFLDDNGASVINELDLKSWVCNHINLVWSNKADGTPLFDFSEVLHWARVHLSTDPRDFVYSLLGHHSAMVGGELLIQPVYTITTAEVYTNLVVNIVERTRSLHILAFVDHGEEPNALGLPTWVPDWHALNLVAPLRCPTQAAPTEYRMATIDGNAPGRNPSLCCQGSIVGTIRACSDMIRPKDLAISGFAAEMKKQTPFLMDHLYATLILTQPSEARPSAEYFISALSFILTGAYRERIPADVGSAIEQQQRADLAAHIVEAETMRATSTSSPSSLSSSSSLPSSFMGSISSEEKAQVEALASSGCATQFVQDMTWTSMCRRVFITQDGGGYLGLGPRTMASGDVVSVVPGSRYPLVLRKMTAKADDTDQVVTYQLVGPALLYGFMDNEMYKAPPSAYLYQELCLV